MVGSPYSPIIWFPIRAFGEDNTSLGYSLPRVGALSGRARLAVVVLSFLFFALQHVLLPFRREWQRVVSHFVGYVPLAIVLSLLYLRQGCLLPVHAIH